MKLPVSDSASLWLVEQIQSASGLTSLWCLDEHTLAQPDAERPPVSFETLTIVSNRWDQADRASRAGMHAHFSDFDFSDWADACLDRVFYRVSKEKPVVHHIINQAGRCLKPGGQLIVCGQKTEGAKTYIEKAAAYLGSPQKARKEGNLYVAQLPRAEVLGQPLDDSDYTSPRAIFEEDGVQFYSKPGLFGWQKRDKGSALLWKEVAPRLQASGAATLLDLGCGYGYLGLMTHRLPLQRRVLTDNNAAALTMAAYNAERNGISAEVIGADCGERITDTFDAVLCNPPFHQGFSVSGDLTDRFLRSAHTHLTPSGRAWFVVNRFIPLEQKAQALFAHIEVLADCDGFKVFELRR